MTIIMTLLPAGEKTRWIKTY